MCVCVCVRSFACIQADVVLHLDCEAYVARADFFLFNSLSYQSFVFSCVFVCIFSRILRSSVIATWNLTAHGTTYRFKISKGEYVFFMHSNCCERQLLKQAQNHFFFALQTYSRIFFSQLFCFLFCKNRKINFFYWNYKFFFSNITDFVLQEKNIHKICSCKPFVFNTYYSTLTLLAYENMLSCRHIRLFNGQWVLCVCV